MASFQASSCITISSISSSSCHRRDLNIKATIKMPKRRTRSLVRPKATSIKELEPTSGFAYTKTTTGFLENISAFPRHDNKVSDPMVITRKFYAIMEAIEDRVEMHKNIGEQRNNWNSLLLTSINTITLTAATMAGIAGTVDTGGAPVTALKVSSTFLYLAATGMLIIMNKIQPSQLVEEQRNAARLFKQLHAEMRTMVSLGNPLTLDDVNQAMDKVLALDRAFPLPLLGVMLEKFPATMEPAVWWPRQQRRRQAKGHGERKNNGNGWDARLEEEMGEIVGVLRRKDKGDYLRLGEKALKLNKALAISGPSLTGLAAIGSTLVGLPSHGSWAVVLGVVAGALSSIVNTVQHGGQVGMVFEMYRCNAGFFRLMEESIQSTLKEEVERRENGELFEMKVALQLGRSLTELKDLAASSSIKGAGMEEFGSKLF